MPASYVSVPERDTMPTLPGVKMLPGMMPILHSPAVITPGQFGPISRDLPPDNARLTFTISTTAIPSVIQTMTHIPPCIPSQLPYPPLDGVVGGSARSVGGGAVGVGFRVDFFAKFAVGAFEPRHQRPPQAPLLHRRDHAFGDDVAFHDAAENVDQDALHFGIGGDDVLGGRGPLLSGAAAARAKILPRLAVEHGH